MKYLLVLFIYNSWSGEVQIDAVPYNFNTVAQCTQAGQQIIASPSKHRRMDVTFQCIKLMED